MRIAPAAPSRPSGSLGGELEHQIAIPSFVILPVSQPVLSLADITDLERAYALGAPTLGLAAAALLARWQLPLRDEETFLRLAFLSWYREHEPEWLTGLEAPLPAVEALVEDRGGENRLQPEARFTIAVLWDLFPPLGADDTAVRQRARSWAEQAAVVEPTSRLFSEWRYILREVEDTSGPRVYIEPEIQARYAGRGAMGAYLAHTLMARLRPGGPLRAAT